MANPTTNYGFVLPTSSDLVTDLPADFDVALQGVDTRLKALQPGTTLGDIAYSSATANTNTRLGIGSTGNVLTVAGGVPTWAAPAAGGMTVIASGSLTSSEVSITSIPGTYNDLQLMVLAFNPDSSDELRLRINNNTGSVYSGRNLTAAAGGFVNTEIFASPAQFGGGTSRFLGTYFMPQYANTTTWKNINCWSMTNGDGSGGVSYDQRTAATNQTAAVTSIQIRTGGGITFSGGTYILYGVK
jgi:hypothetical protein